MRKLPAPSRLAAPPLEARAPLGLRSPSAPEKSPPPELRAPASPSGEPPFVVPSPQSSTPAPVVTTAPPFPWIAAKRSADVTPLSPDRYKVQVTIGGETLEKLRRAKDLLRHAVPSGDEATILDRALTALLALLAQRKFAATERPRPAEGTAKGSRHIPAEVKRAVWRRDLGRCAFVGTSGRRCAERGFLEFHHVRPYAAGGEATVKNIQLRCRSHNGYEARVFFGPARGPSTASPGTRKEAPGAQCRPPASRS